MTIEIRQGDALSVLREMESGSVQCAITSPPYWGLRDYGVSGQLGLEATPEEYVEYLVEIFGEVRRVLRVDGTAWLNLGDSYASDTKGSGGSGKSTLGPNKDLQNIQFQKFTPHSFKHGVKSKDLVGIPWMVAFALRADGWYLRSDIIWSKPNAMPESVTDRPTKAHEYVFLLSKSAAYYYDIEAIKEPSVYPDDNRKARSSIGDKRMPTEKIAGVRPGSATYPTRNRRSVWTINTAPYKGAHFATFPPKLVEPMILAGTSEKGACGECGAAWERVVEREKHPERDMEAQRLESATKTGRTDGHVQGPSGMVDKTRTTGWKATCKHNTSVVPCVVLDPFAGSGTVGAVCVEHNRSFIGIELNPAYITLAQERITKVRMRDPRWMRDTGATLPEIARELRLSVPEVARMLRG